MALPYKSPNDIYWNRTRTFALTPINIENRGIAGNNEPLVKFLIFTIAFVYEYEIYVEK
jgi:hypothetical protein